MKTFATLFSGCEGAGVGLSMAGLTELWGIENNPKAAAIAKLNGFSPMVADVCSIPFTVVDKPDWLHVSPPCQTASVANSKGGETDSDFDLAMVIRRAIFVLRPKMFTLENVAGYRHFQSFSAIKARLLAENYACIEAVLDAADYGVPQNRKRLWLVASRVSTPRIPMPTHQPFSTQLDMFGAKSWASWEKAIAHIPFQKDGWNKRMESALLQPNMPRSLVTGFKNIGGSFDRPLTIRAASQPSPTLMASCDCPTLLPWVVDGDQRLRLDVPHLAALQSFPPDYKWGDDRTAARRAIGNSVPPLIMQRIAEANVSQSFAMKAIAK